MTGDHKQVLHQLAALYQLETSFYDGLGILREPSQEVLVKVLRSLGASLERVEDAPSALEARREEIGTRAVEPVVVAWNGKLAELPIRAPESQSTHLRLRIDYEDGGEEAFDFDKGSLRLDRSYDINGVRYERRLLSLPHELPFGYHKGALELSSGERSFLIISSPQQAFSTEEDSRSWGLFLPLYALRSRRCWGCGDLSDLSQFIEWMKDCGGRFFGTLPLFASFLDHPFDPSPYAPVSRLFWNEFYIDPEKTQEWEKSTCARELFQEATFQEELAQLRQKSIVDYQRIMNQKRKILEILARECFEKSSSESSEIQEFASLHPRVVRYGEFRAVHSKRQDPWFHWPEELQQGQIEPSEFSSEERDYHVYCQWVASSQMKELLSSCRQKEIGLYLDLPLGVHPDGFDAWFYADSFARGCSGGAPPDGFFTAGQDWGFRPLHPEAIRSTQYRYLRAVIRKMMSSTDLIRIDHAMSLHRLYWIPHGLQADEGLYVRYPMDELFAVFVLESHRNRCRVAGEDLGTVSPELREQMATHDFARMYVGQFEISAWPPVNPSPARVVASLNTHDTPTAAAFWQGKDIDDRLEMGLLDEGSWAREKKGRRMIRDSFLDFFEVTGEAEDPEVLFEVIEKWLLYLAESPAEHLLVNLEDLWLETEPQNVPGTGPERPNWRRKARYFLEQFKEDPQILNLLAKIDRARN